MDRDLSAAVEGYRRRIRAQAEVTQRLEELVRGLEAGPAAEGGEQAEPALRRARADLERSEADLRALKREYASFRLREAMGPDAAWTEAAIFDDAIMALTSGRLTRREARGPRDGPIGFDGFRTMLLADLPLGQLVENEAAERRSGALFDPLEEQTSSKNILRRWTARLESDPYVANILRCAREAAARFGEHLGRFTLVFDSVRLSYELRQKKVDHLAFVFLGRQPAIQAANYWENVERACPKEAAALLEHFHGLDSAREELKRLRDELNMELRAFMGCFFPRCLTYAMGQSKARQLALGLRSFSPRRLCRYVLEQVERTDFLLPRGGNLEIEVPRIPPELAPFRKAKAYLAYKRRDRRAAEEDASTMEDATG
ncbi:MAG: hypothetical protein FJ291_14595 [Planctomycetes bacterium]|nr:hypothetical protein [Planctomycetota bacterium]